MKLDFLPDAVGRVRDADYASRFIQRSGVLSLKIDDDGFHAVPSFRINFRYSESCG